MKEFIKKISVTILSFIVLFSSMSFTVEKHYCGETLVDVSYFGKAEGCGMDGMRMNFEQAEKKMKKCCKNETELIKTSDFDKEKPVTLQQPSIEFVAFFIQSYINLYQETQLEKEYYKDFSPPDVEKDIQILHQTFLI